ncbi:hypothetical protein GQ44DRAFT_710227 [Phaeosphaeriaceae sp. PMI808]|nr:hypothetical protein GQ44DRAFT_710227 [Phaeosphaeriaceae sp. PMI808]
MVVTTRRGTAPAEPAQTTPARSKRAVKAAPVTTTSRRLRSKQTASPLKVLDQEPKRTVHKSETKKTSIQKTVVTKSKRKRNTQHHEVASASATPEPETVERESAQDESFDDQGIFFTQNINTFGIDGIDPEEGLAPQPEFIQGSESALALLHKIESAARASRLAPPSESSEVTSSQHASSHKTKAQAPHTTSDSTPSRTISTPSSFFSRSFSAIKSKLGFSTSTPVAPSPSTTPRALPQPDSVTEWLSTPPTPVGERSKARPKKIKLSPMLRLLLKGVEPEDMKAAENWAKHIIPALKNDDAFAAKRKRLETPVLFEDLNNFPARKPWETAGFGDPLGDLDDEDVVPVWAVYLDMLAEAEEPQQKKTKTTHQGSMDVEDTPSINEVFAASNSAPTTPTPGSSKRTAAFNDFHPRRSIEPSPMFESPTSHENGNNIFRELNGPESTAQIPTDNSDNTTKTDVPRHDPAHGSFGLDYDSDDEDTTMISETSEADAGATPIWTQPPPPAPVPAHIPLPGGPSAEASSASTTQQPVDEIERQRQKLMKHTPAKPSRLREAFVPSPSLMSDAGNDSVLIATPLPAAGLFGDMPGAAELALSEDDLAAANALRHTSPFKAASAITAWPDATLTYESDEEELSPI